jgi:DNA polymerase III gamma/tau subunit
LKEHFPTLNLDVINELYTLIPEQQALALLAQAMNKDIATGETEAAIQKIIDDIDWNPHTEQLGKLISKILPIEQLVPDIYADWQPIVRDSLFFIATRLSSKRLIPKLIEQLMLPDKASLSLAWSAQWYGFRTGLQTSERLFKLFY